MRLVEDVDLVAALDRLEDDAVADLADVVDAALRRGVHLDTSSDVPAVIARQAWQVPSGVVVGPCAQLRHLARMRAIDVLPVPRGPAKRYAWRTASVR